MLHLRKRICCQIIINIPQNEIFPDKGHLKFCGFKNSKYNQILKKMFEKIQTSLLKIYDHVLYKLL